MSAQPVLDLEARIERRYVRLASIARSVSAVGDFRALAAAVASSIAEPLEEERVPGVRLWAITPDGVEELARHPHDRELANVPQRELQRAARLSEPAETADGRLLVGLHSAGVTLGVLEVEDGVIDAELLGDIAPVVACSAGLLAGQGVGDVLPSPVSVDGASDVASLMANFAAEAKRLLDHDRLSAYLLTAEGRAFERFAVATSPIIPGEGVIIPFEDVGLRHVVMTNRALVSADLAADARIVGREDRVIARAGFHGLISVPLRLGGRPFGVLNFVSRRPGFYSEQDIPIAEQIADQVAGFIDNLHAQERMRTLIRHEAVQSARARVARDVYHAVAQTIPAIDALAGDLERRLAGGDADGSEKARRVRELLRFELADVRRAVADLVPRALDSQALDEALRAAIGGFGEDDPEARLTVEGDVAELTSAVRRATFRIFQEAVANARLHAQARTLEVALRVDCDLELTVTDDGAGFDPESAGRSSGTGIQFMRERAQALGGTLSVESAPGRGTTVRFGLLGARDSAEAEGHGHEEQGDRPGSAAVKLRVFVTVPHSLIRAGLVALLERDGQIRVVGEAAGSDEALGQIKRLHPDVVVMEGHRCEGELERTIAEIKAALPGCSVLMVADLETAQEAELIEAGASGVVPRSITPVELADSVRAVARGGKVASFASPLSTQGGASLSARERAVLTLMTAGRTNAEIGGTLFLATKTVERQVATIIRKLDARNRAHAGAIAVARQLVDPADLEQ